MAFPMKKETKIKREKDRLISILSDAGVDINKSPVLGLINDMAWQKVILEDIRKDIDLNGLTEPFQQSMDVPPYARERPISKQYATIVKLFQASTKQILDLIAKTGTDKSDDSMDLFKDFIKSRD